MGVYNIQTITDTTLRSSQTYMRNSGEPSIIWHQIGVHSTPKYFIRQLVLMNLYFDLNSWSRIMTLYSLELAPYQGKKGITP